MSRAEERRLLLRLCDIHGYRILEMPAERDRMIGAFKRTGRRMTYSVATVVRLVAPQRSWLAAEMKKKRSSKGRKPARAGAKP